MWNIHKLKEQKIAKKLFWKEIVSLKNHTNCKGKCTANSSVCRMNQQLDENKCE